MPAIVKVFSTTNSKLAQLPVSDGNLIFVKDTKSIYLDLNGNRLSYTEITVLPLETDRTSILAPVEGFYYVEETDILWRYKEGWKQITPNNVSPLFFGDYEDFPPTGKENVLYISDEATYKWDSLTSTYICIANKTEWKSLGD
jgi:hypothetical protein